MVYVCLAARIDKKNSFYVMVFVCLFDQRLKG